MQTIKPAAEKLLNIGYLNSFEYNAETRLVSGEVNKMMVSPSTEGLGQLPNAEEKRKKIIQQFIALGTYPNPTTTIINSLPEDLLDDAEITAELITREKSENAFGIAFRYGGRALKQLKNLQATGEISQSLLERVHQESLVGNTVPNQEFELPADSTQNAAQVFKPDPQNENAQVQLPLPISFTAIRAVSPEAENLWSKCFSILKAKLSNQIVESWFTEKSVSPVAIEENMLLMQPVSDTCLNWIQSTYSKILQDSLDEATHTREQWQIKWVL